MLTVWAVSSSEHFGPVSIRPSVSLSHHAYTQNDSRGAAPTAKDEGKRILQPSYKEWQNLLGIMDTEVLNNEDH